MLPVYRASLSSGDGTAEPVLHTSLSASAWWGEEEQRFELYVFPLVVDSGGFVPFLKTSLMWGEGYFPFLFAGVKVSEK